MLDGNTAALENYLSNEEVFELEQEIIDELMEEGYSYEDAYNTATTNPYENY